MYEFYKNGEDFIDLSDILDIFKEQNLNEKQLKDIRDLLVDRDSDNQRIKFEKFKEFIKNEYNATKE